MSHQLSYSKMYVVVKLLCCQTPLIAVKFVPFCVKPLRKLTSNKKRYVHPDHVYKAEDNILCTSKSG